MKTAAILAGLVLATLIVLGVMNAQSVDRVQTVVEKPSPVVEPEAQDQLGGQDQPVDGDSPDSPAVEEPQRQAGDAGAPPEATPPAAEATPAVDHSNCPHPVICQTGDCQQDYAIVFSTPWCGPCKALHRVTDKLRLEGYRIYYWDADAAPTMAKKFKIDNVPTTLFFNHGQLSHRQVGLINEQPFRDFLKPRKASYDLTE